MHWMAVVLGVVLALTAVGDDGVRVALVFREAPVEQVTALYSDLTGHKVEVEDGVYGRISLRTEQDVTKGEAIRLVEEALREQNIGLFPKVPNIVTARWINPALRPQGTPTGLSSSTPVVLGTATNEHTRPSYEAWRVARDRLRRELREAWAARTNVSGEGRTVGAIQTNATEGILGNEGVQH